MQTHPDRRMLHKDMDTSTRLSAQRCTMRTPPTPPSTCPRTSSARSPQPLFSSSKLRAWETSRVPPLPYLHHRDRSRSNLHGQLVQIWRPGRTRSHPQMYHSEATRCRRSIPYPAALNLHSHTPIPNHRDMQVIRAPPPNRRGNRRAAGANRCLATGVRKWNDRSRPQEMRRLWR